MSKPSYNTINTVKTDVESYQFELIRSRFALIKDLLDNEDVTNIFINRFDNIYYDIPQGRMKFDGAFESDQALADAIYSVGNSKRLRFDTKNSLLHANLPDGSRIQASRKPTNANGTSINIRLFRKKRMTLQDLYNNHLFGFEKDKADTILRYLQRVVHEKHNFLVVGSTNSGKSTLLNAMMKEIPSTADHIVTVEDVRELLLDNQLVTHYYTGDMINEDAKNDSYYTMEGLIATAMRSSPDRLFVGEIRQKQAATAFYDSLNSGHEGVASTIHSYNAVSALDKLANFIVQERNIGYEYAVAELKKYIKTIIFVKKGVVGNSADDALEHRMITEIIEFDDSGFENKIV